MSRRTASAWTALGSAVLALTAAVGLAAPAQADTVGAATAPPLRFVSYNICGNMCVGADHDNAKRIDSVVAQAAVGTWNADQIFLQEVCRPQYDEILSRLAPLGFKGHYTPTISGKATVCGGADYGNAVLVKGPVTATADLDLTVGGEAEPIKIPCVRNYIQSRANWACSVHLYWDDGTLAAPEAEKLAAQAEAWQAQGTPVVLGGDFNHTPRTTSLRPFYDKTIGDAAEGTFVEADETDTEFFDPAACTPGTQTRCRSGETTRLDKKLDYVFFSRAHFKTPKGDALPLDTAVSDHRMVRGAASWADCGAFAPATGALFRRDASGALFRYTGKGDGTLSGACKTGTGWTGMRQVVRPTGSTTLAALDAGGVLWHYPADAAGAYSGSTRVQAATGWGAYDRILAPGDSNGDGRADLVTRDTAGDLWLHAGTGAHSYAAPVRIGTGWSGYEALLSPGDFSGDGRADLLARDAAGDLWLFRGNGQGGYEARVRIGTNWDVYTALTSPGDVNGDGRADLLGRDAAGDLYFYKGDGAGGYAPRVRTGSGYPAGELLF
ncbi:endonuclease/exonuclease/phosphatase family protein [Streptomyces sp. NPDC101118]|uniref:endonuclease/exonuclease/phosphatase family protein n=1 Tax=Streptomyces sp. NPDC101118 TaxID=3366109 RepID=UPI0038175A96